MATTVAFRALDDAGKLPDNYVNPYYLENLKRRVSVARAGGKLYAFDDLCKHEGCPLSSGLLTGTTLMCQCHGSQYDITSAAVGAPAELRLDAKKEDVIPLYPY
jgi:nitrite reductase/ring-hydroxylating ferredoxin subunit